VIFPDNSELSGVKSVDNIFTPKAFKVKDLTSLPRPHYKINSITQLGSTPKGSTLKNIWGTDKNFNI